MKTTLDLPAQLLGEMKLLAALQGRKLKDVAVALLASGLAAESLKSKTSRVSRTGIKFPLFPCAEDAPALRMSMAQISALEQETQTREDLERLGLPL